LNLHLSHRNDRATLRAKRARDFMRVRPRWIVQFALSVPGNAAKSLMELLCRSGEGA
jgi:hypothetical protein